MMPTDAERRMIELLGYDRGFAERDGKLVVVAFRDMTDDELQRTFDETAEERDEAFALYERQKGSGE